VSLSLTGVRFFWSKISLYFGEKLYYADKCAKINCWTRNSSSNFWGCRYHMFLLYMVKTVQNYLFQINLTNFHCVLLCKTEDTKHINFHLSLFRQYKNILKVTTLQVRNLNFNTLFLFCCRKTAFVQAVILDYVYTYPYVPHLEKCRHSYTIVLVLKFWRWNQPKSHNLVWKSFFLSKTIFCQTTFLGYKPVSSGKVLE